MKLAKLNIPLSDEDAKSGELLSLSRELVNSRDFANGHDVDTVAKMTYAQLAKRSLSRRTSTSLNDIKEAINSLILSRKPQETSKSCTNGKNYQNQAHNSSSFIPPTTTSTF